MKNKDRLRCNHCKKDIINLDRKAILSCPHCGGTISALDWIEGGLTKQVEAVDKANSLDEKGIGLLTLGKFQEAIKCFDEGLTICPVDADLWNNKGIALRSMGQREEAIKCFDKAIPFYKLSNAINKSSKVGDPWRNKGATLLELRKHKEAIMCFDEAISINAEDAKAWLAKGMVLFELGKPGDGMECFRRADALGFPPAKLALNQYEKIMPTTAQAKNIKTETVSLKKPWWKFW